MTAKDLFFTIENSYIRNALSEISAGFSRNIGIQKTLLAQAWIAIADMPKAYTTEAYIARGYAVMRNKYEIYYMPEPDGKPSNDAGIQRARRALKYYV